MGGPRLFRRGSSIRPLVRRGNCEAQSNQSRPQVKKPGPCVRRKNREPTHLERRRKGDILLLLRGGCVWQNAGHAENGASLCGREGDWTSNPPSARKDARDWRRKSRMSPFPFLWSWRSSRSSTILRIRPRRCRPRAVGSCDRLRRASTRRLAQSPF